MNVTAIHVNHQLTRAQKFEMLREQCRRMLAMRNHKEKTDEEIAQWFHMALVTARRHMLHETRRLGYEVARRRWPNIELPKLTMRQAGTRKGRNAVFAALNRGGVSREQIAATYQVSVGTVHQELGKQRKRNGEAKTETPTTQTEMTMETPRQIPHAANGSGDGGRGPLVPLADVPEMVGNAMQFCYALFSAERAEEFSAVATTIVDTRRMATNTEGMQAWVGNLTMALMKQAAAIPHSEETKQ